VSAAHDDLLRPGIAEAEITLSVAVLSSPGYAGGGIDREMKEAVRAPEEAELTSEQLAQRSKAGCLDAFEQLVRRYEGRIFGFFRQFTGNHHDAEDLTQETFVKAHRNLHRYDPSRLFAPWLFTIARRTGASYFRSERAFEELHAPEESSEETPATTLEHKDERASIWKLVRTLKPKHAQVIWLRYAEGFSIAETAGIMRTNQIHVKVMLHRARSQLSRMLIARGFGLANQPVQVERSMNGPNAGITKAVL